MKPYKLATLLFIVICAIAISTPHPASAASADVTIMGTPYQKIDEYLAPGDTRTGSIAINNGGEEEAIISITVSPFSYETDNNGDYIQNFTTESTRTMLSKWIKISGDTTRTIPPQTRVDIDYSFTIPLGIVGGSQSAIILIQNITDQASPGETGLGVEARAGYPVYINIAGAGIIESAETTFHADTFLLSPPIKATVTIRNTGNISYRASLDFTVNNSLGGSLAYEDKQSFEVLPDTTLSAFHEWQSAPLLGIFNITEAISYLEKIESSSVTVIIIPLWLLLLIIVALALAIVRIVIVVRKARRAKTKISTHFEI